MSKDLMVRRFPRVLVAVLVLHLVWPGVASAAEGISYRSVIDLTFPVPPDAVWEPSPTTFETTAVHTHYDADRGTRDGKPRKHQATDLMVPEGTPVYAARGGRVTWMPNDGKTNSHYYVIVEGDDGRSYSYLHLGTDNGPVDEAYAPGVQRGAEVERGQLLGWAGCSGSATCGSGSHLHFEVEAPDVIDDPYYTDPDYYHYSRPRLDPYPSLRAALLEGDVPGAVKAAPVPDDTLLEGDFDGDGRGDVARYSPADGSWFVTSSASGKTSVWVRFKRTQGWKHVVGDFDGDGRDDVGSFNLDNGRWVVSRSTGSGFTYSVWHRYSTTRGWTHVVGDFDDDGRDDLGSFHAGTGNLVVSPSQGSGFGPARVWGDYVTARGWQSHVVGDFDGDGVDDVASYHRGAGTVRVNVSTGSGFVGDHWARYVTAKGWQSHLVGDFDGDGVDDLVSYHRGAGSVRVNVSTGSGFVGDHWARYVTAKGWQSHLVDDFDGNGVDDLASYHSGAGTWRVNRSTGDGFRGEHWAYSRPSSGWVGHVPADLDADGRADAASYHPDTATLRVQLSEGGTFEGTDW